MDNKSYIGTLGGGVLVVVLFSLLSGCSPKIVERAVTVTVTEVRDSTAWRDTTIYVPIPLESDQAIVHVGDTSHRETSIAESDAWISQDGFLHHTLNNKPRKLAYQISLPERYLISSVRNTNERAHIITRKVEKELSPWQRFRIGAFWWLLALAAAEAFWIFRKPLLKLLHR